MFFLILFFLLNANLAEAKKGRNWNNYVDYFRSDHNFAFTFGHISGNWDIDRFATLESDTIRSTGVFTKLSYSFHIPIKGALGYFLGSSVGGTLESTGDQNLKAPYSVQLPGFLVGFVWDVSSSLRFLCRLDMYLERITGMRDNSGNKVLNANMVTWTDGSFIFDYFIDLNVGLRSEYHMRQSIHNPMNNSGPANIESAKFTKNDEWLGFGMVYHFL